MTTFTIRIPEAMAGRLGSAEVRAWLSGFLRSPHQLPEDPGPGDCRVSLTLPEELVRQLAEHLLCRPSSALRRLAVSRLGIHGGLGLAGGQTNAVSSGAFARLSPAQNSERSVYETNVSSGIAFLIEICFALVVVGVMVLSRSPDANS